MERKRLLTVIETAIMAALAFVLGKVSFAGFWPQGGDISLVMIPLVILSFRRGIGAGVTAGVIVGLLGAMFGGYIVHPIQALLDYPIAFGVLGLAGLFNKAGEKPTFGGVITGVIVAGLLRLVSHTVSGVVWFAEYAPEDMNLWVYSILYNASYIIPEIIISSVIIGVFYFKFTYLMKPDLQR